MRRYLKSASKAGLAAIALGVGVSLFTATVAEAAVVQNPNTASYFLGPGPGGTLMTGTFGSTTIFNIQLPVNAKCSFGGGTGELAYSFMVATNTSLTASNSLTYSFPPEPDQGTALATAGGAAVPSLTPASDGTIGQNMLNNLEMANLLKINGNTLQGPTQISSSGSALIPTGMQSESYILGTACIAPSNSANAGLTDWWSQCVTFNLANTGPNADPNGFTWTPCEPAGNGLPEAPLAVGLPLGGATVIGAAAFLARRRRRQAPTVATA